MATSKKKLTKIDSKAAAEALEYLFAAGYIDKKRLYLENFIRGLFFSLGSIIGATVLIVLLLWVLSLFDDLPLVGNFVRTIQDSIKTR